MVEVCDGEEGLCPSPDVRVKAQPGRTDGDGRGRLEFHSPQRGGACGAGAVAGSSGDGHGNGGSGPSSSRGDPLHRKDPWHGAAPNHARRSGLQLRASGGGGEPPEPSDDGGGSDGRRDSRLPEDMLKSFRNRMRQLNDDMNEGPGRDNGRGSGRRGPGGGGGDD
eukprot:6466086-Amphidinium_carterae.1